MSLGWRQRGDVHIPIEIVPSVISRPAIIRSSVDLPQPDGPTRTINPVGDREADIVLDRDDSAGERLGDVLELDLGHRQTTNTRPASCP